MNYTAESVMVNPVDTDKLEAIANATALGNITFRAHRMAIVFSPVQAVLNQEFIGYDLKDEDSIDVDFWETELLPDGGESGSIFPTKQMNFTVETIKPYLMPEITLAEFTKERRGYNSRIRCNEQEWVRVFNKS